MSCWQVLPSIEIGFVGRLLAMDKIKVKVVMDEWYPVYAPAENDYFQKDIEISAKLWKRYLKAFGEFAKLHNELNDELSNKP
jgi:hypothetical protein